MGSQLLLRSQEHYFHRCSSDAWIPRSGGGVTVHASIRASRAFVGCMGTTAVHELIGMLGEHGFAS